MTKATKVLFIGLDAAERDLLLDWSASGLLPNLRALRDRGVWADAPALPGLGSGALWPSFSTGINPARHGRFFGFQMGPGTYETQKHRFEEGQWRPFWKVLSDARRRVAVLNVPYDSLCDDINGVQVVNMGIHNPQPPGFGVSPAELTSEINDRFGADPVGKCDHYNSSHAELQELGKRLVERVHQKAKVSCEYLDQGGWDLFLTVFDESHCVGHQAWHLHDPSHPRYDAKLAQAIGDPVKDVYVAIDGAIGKLLERVDRETGVILFSGTGMGPNYSGNHLLDDILARLEKARFSVARPIAKTMRSAWHYIPPRIRARYRFMGRRVEQTMLKPERSSRKTFAVLHNDISGAVRINTVGREPKGQIAPGPEFEAFCAQLTQDLLEIKNLESGEPLVKNVVRTTDLYKGEHASDFADLFVVWNRSGPVSSVGSPKIGKIVRPFTGNRTGDHTDHGLFLCCAPGLKPGYCKTPVSVLDFAPTVASLLGVALPEAEGQPIRELCDVSMVDSPV